MQPSPSTLERDDADVQQPSAVPLTRGEPPPDHYYAQNLQQLLQFVRRRYAAVLDPGTRQCIDAVAVLPTEAVRLLARLLTRKGPAFRRRSCAYREITDPDRAVAALVGAGLVAEQAALRADALLGIARLQELRSWFPQHASRSKAALVHALLVGYSDSALQQQLRTHMHWLSLPCAKIIGDCQWLYFGDHHQDLHTFVTADLGLVQYPAYRLVKPDWLTDEPQCLVNHEHLRRYTGWARALRRDYDDSALARALALRLQALPVTRQQRQLRDRALLRLGRYLEQRGHLQDAVAAYRNVREHPARERQVRLLTKLQQPRAAQQLLAEMRIEPLCAAEQSFAERFGKPRRQALHPQTELSLVAATPAHIERCAAQLLLHSGGSAWHLENRLPLGITGLLYWPVIYADVPGMFTRPFQTAPTDLFWPDFVQARAPALQALEAQWLRAGVCDETACRAALLQTLHRHTGTANPLVSWGLFDEDFLAQLLAAVPVTALARLAAFVIRQLGQYRRGFPDLLVAYPNGTYEFVEVKGPNDQLQDAQRRWLSVLAELSLPARVLKLRACPTPVPRE